MRGFLYVRRCEADVKDRTLYKSIEIEGVRFDIYYGYYNENEKESGYPPTPIYPDFSGRLQYTKNGLPFVTAYQDVCNYYQPINKETDFVGCGNCKLYESREELIGLCKAKERKKREKT